MLSLPHEKVHAGSWRVVYSSLFVRSWNQYARELHPFAVFPLETIVVQDLCLFLLFFFFFFYYFFSLVFFLYVKAQYSNWRVNLFYAKMSTPPPSPSGPDYAKGRAKTIFWTVVLGLTFFILSNVELNVSLGTEEEAKEESTTVSSWWILIIVSASPQRKTKRNK